MASVTSQLIEEITAHAQSDNFEDAREICADGTYSPNNLRTFRTESFSFTYFVQPRHCVGYMRVFFRVSTVVSGFCFLSISEFHVGLVLHCVSRFSEDDTSVPKHVAVGTYRELWFVSYILLHFINFICWLINLMAPELFFNFITPCIQNVNNTGTKYVRIMKQTAFWRWKNLEYIPCLKYSVPIFVE